ncbi:putative short chain alcohol dehydrogenase [Elsinoe ampelina]|uniref:Putative short chain alcohol dehydrogenase n=1 Tax=Elsinoe ampelina TaxID=302913 RepID=A0A6A6G061_9PEZI|nr:putative short chain alcohol dehydrogenase [Elsinoe ampelina]
MSLNNKVFVVTGAASGIGRALVVKLLDQSATVHSIDLSEIPPLDDHPGKHVSHSKVDVSSRSAVAAVFKAVAEQQRDIWLDGLVNCAGLLRDGACTTDSKGDENFAACWQVNVMGVWNMITEYHAYLLALRAKDAARYGKTTTSIVNIGSMASVRGIPYMTAYVASKHAVHGITRALAQELGPAGFRVNTIGPGQVNTPMIANRYQAPVDGKYTGAYKTMSEPEEIADTAIFLLGPGSSSIAGQIIEVNGGWA